MRAIENTQMELEYIKTLSHLNAHVVNRLLRENRKSILNFLSGKNLSKM